VIVTVRAWTNRRLAQQAERLERDSAIRTRIAQNIHDDLGANLTQISLLTQAARQNPSASAKNFEQIHATVSAITRSMDEVVWAVNPKFDDVESLAGYLGDFARDFLSVAGIRCRLGLPEKLPTLLLASQVRHHAFLCCKEALHNVVKHARATEVTIAMAVEGTRLTVIIEDNGRGVQAAASEARPADRTATGNGLENMRRRMAEIGGTFSIGPGASGGTRIVFSVECRPVSP
jgi:signal transduction histidine kinase